MVVQGVRGSDAAARRLIVREERPDRPGPALSRQSQTVLRIRNATSEDKIDRRVEVTAVLEKEWPLFRKENLKPLVDGGLRLVGFDLGEIRIDGGVEDQPILKDNFGVQAAAWFKTLPEELRGRIAANRTG